jgi:phage I-like protein
MPIKLNHSGLAHAHALIKAGKINRGGSWLFEAEDGNRLLGTEGKDWKSYAEMHLGEDTSQAENTKDRWKYPFGKGGDVYRQGVIAAKSRAAAEHETEITSAADSLLQEIDKVKEHVKAKAVLLRGRDDAFACVSDLMVPGDEIPTEIQLLPIGEWKGYTEVDASGKLVKRTIKVTPDDCDEMVVNFGNMGRDVVIDYEHQTESGDEAPAAAWIKRLVAKGAEGLWAIVDWTDRAIQYLRAREYRFLSPVFSTRGALDKVTGKPIGAVFYSAALTNQPFIDILKPIVAKSSTSTSQESVMTEHFKKLFKAVCTALGHTPDDDFGDDNVDKVHEKFKAHVAGLGKAGKFKKDLLLIVGAGENASEEEIITVAKTKLNAQPADVASLKTRIDQLESEKREKEATDAFNEAFNAGKILPAVRDEALAWARGDVAKFKAFYAKVPKGSAVPVQHIETGSPAADDTTLTELDKAICKNLGLSEKTFLAAKKEQASKQRK